MNMAPRLVLLCWILAFLATGCRTVGDPDGEPRPPRASITYIDGHNHLFGGRQGEEYASAARAALKTMDELGISRMIIMPPPQVPFQRGAFPMQALVPIVRSHPDRFALLGGGGTLNVMIHKYKDHDPVPLEASARFREQALEILATGAIGFGEFSVLHFSMNHDHPYQEVRADHPLFLLLADIAAERGVPVDIHMEAVPRDMPLPDRAALRRSGRNPPVLQENLPAFERLLAHNRGARIIWAHAGWCNTGERTAGLCRELLSRHPNLFMSFKLSPDSVPETRPLSSDQTAVRPEWLALIRDFPDRFFIGTDQFYVRPGGRTIGPQKTEATRTLMELLPPDLAQKVGVENPQRLFF